MMDIISPMFGMHEEKKEPVRTVKKNSVKKPKKKDNSLVQVISPYYGNFEEKEVILKSKVHKEKEEVTKSEKRSIF